MSGLEIVGGITAAITLVDTTLELRRRYIAASEVPQAFEEVMNRLPLVKQTLLQAKENAGNGNITPEDAQAAMKAVTSCREKTMKLEQIFIEVAPVEEGASVRARWNQVRKTMKHSDKVEYLAKGIFQDLQTLAQRWSMDAVTRQDLKDAMNRLESIEPSMEDTSNSVYGSGGIFHNHGSGKMYPIAGSNHTITFGKHD
jgi:hypothetical protein